MSTTTTNYNLTKPDKKDIFNIDTMNSNSDIIDKTLKDHTDGIGNLTTNKAPLVSPTFTGTVNLTSASVLVPTYAQDTASSLPASTAFVINQASATAPLPDGVATIGTSKKYARADHIHPNDALIDSTGYGVISGLNVYAQTTPNMTIGVISGVIHKADGTRLVSSGIVSIALPAADATNPTIRTIVLTPTGGVSYQAGTPSPTPVAPTPPTGYTLLAEVYISAGATSITSANITDKRKMANTTDGLATKIADVTASLSDKANNSDSTRTTTDKTVTGSINELNANKLNKTSIVNNTTATVAGSVLDAVQGKVLQDSINTITNKLSLGTPTSDLNNAKTFGYYTFGSTASNSPSGGSTGMCLVVPFDSNLVMQVAFLYGVPAGFNIRQCTAGTWSAWTSK